jgi:hypothetical protein
LRNDAEALLHRNAMPQRPARSLSRRQSQVCALQLGKVDVMTKKERWNKPQYYTTVTGQRGIYTVYHDTPEDMKQYQAQLKKQNPYFEEVESGKR